MAKFRKFNFNFVVKICQKGPNYGNASNTFSYSSYFDDFPKLFLETTKFNTPINCLFTSASFTILGGSDTDAEESKNPSLLWVFPLAAPKVTIDHENLLYKCKQNVTSVADLASVFL